MYAGAGLLICAMPIALGSYWAFLLVLPMGVGVVLRILNEEHFLLKKLPGYKEYCRKVRYRLIPYFF
jgi:protein-S-isoprenylcysteine O-methyltransferase Ste14